MSSFVACCRDRLCHRGAGVSAVSQRADMSAVSPRGPCVGCVPELRHVGCVTEGPAYRLCLKLCGLSFQHGG